MSLRSRLLVAIGVITLAALAIADVVTYSSLQSFLYQRVDQQLDASHGFFERLLNEGGDVACAGPGSVHRGGPRPAGTGPGGPDNGPASNAIQVSAVQVRTAGGAVVSG